jgi:hypothetical protein
LAKWSSRWSIPNNDRSQRTLLALLRSRRYRQMPRHFRLQRHLGSPTSSTERSQPLSNLPAIRGDDDGLPGRYLARARRAQLGAELEVFQHEVRAVALSTIDQIDAQSIADAARCSLEEELRLLEEGLARTGTSKAALELVARKVNILSTSNDRRLNRRFGR